MKKILNSLKKHFICRGKNSEMHGKFLPGILLLLLLSLSLSDTTLAETAAQEDTVVEETTDVDDTAAEESEQSIAFLNPTYSDLSYTKNRTFNIEQSLDLYLPEESDEAVPVLVYIHGGSWDSGDKMQEGVTDLLTTAMQHGYAVASINYRLQDDDVYMQDMVNDCKTAIRFLRAKADTYHLDAGRIAVFGTSAGGQLAMLLGTTNGDPAYEDTSLGYAAYSSDVQMVISLYGVADFTVFKDIYEFDELSGILYFSQLFGYGYSQEDLIKYSPLYQLDAGDAPMFIAAGKNDTKVPPETQSIAMADKALEILGEDLVTSYFPAYGPHAYAVYWNKQKIQDKIFGFMNEQWIRMGYPAIEGIVSEEQNSQTDTEAESGNSSDGGSGSEGGNTANDDTTVNSGEASSTVEKDISADQQDTGKSDDSADQQDVNINGDPTVGSGLTTEEEAARQKKITAFRGRKPVIRSLVSTRKTITVKWKKVSGTYGYRVSYSLKKSMTGAKVVRTRSTEKKIRNLKKKTRYYITVRAYTFIGGTRVYSKVSTRKSIRTKK